MLTILKNCPLATPHLCFLPQDPASLRNIWVCLLAFAGLPTCVPCLTYCMCACRVVEELIG